MKKLRLFFGAAFIIAAGSAFTTKNTDRLVLNSFYLKPSCAAAVPIDCDGGLQICKTSDNQDVYQGTTCANATLVINHQ